MKKLLLIFTLCIVTISTISAESRWGVVVGADQSDLKFDQNLFKVEKSYGAVAGVTGEMMMPGIGFGVDASLLYVMRGAKLHLGEKEIWASQGYGTENLRLHYIELPLNLKFKYTNLGGIEDYIAPIIFGGPSFSLLVANSSVDAMKLPQGDFALHVGIGAELYKKYQINASYSWGMSYSAQTKLLNDFSAKNRTLKITFSYFF